MEEDYMLPKAVFAAIAAVLIIALAGFIVNDAPREEPTDAGTLTIDTSNTAQMHEYGLPTKTDVVEWHVHGHWAYRANGHSYIYADLPGGSEVWDGLYDITANDVFIK